MYFVIVRQCQLCEIKVVKCIVRLAFQVTGLHDLMY